LPGCFWVGEPQSGEEQLGGGGEGDVAVPADEGAAFEVVESEAGLEFAVVVFDAPAQLRQSDETPIRRLGGQVRQPVPGGLRLTGRPFGDQPADRQVTETDCLPRPAVRICVLRLGAASR
jgi:hypothetical protein